MLMAAAVQRLFPSFESRGNLVRDSWDRLAPIPGGRRLFSELIGRMAPYSGSIGAQIVELAPGRSRVVLRDRRAVRNHLRCVHAIALANLAEVTGNIALAYSLPDDARFIVSAIHLDYLQKARGTITGVCEAPPIHSSARREYEIPVELLDARGDTVTRATLTSLVGPKRP